MKCLWRNWSDLRFNVTGVGWNVVTGTVEADDEWWKRNLKESDKYKRFRRKGVDPELTELWDTVYSVVSATGKHVVATGMDPPLESGDIEDKVDIFSESGPFDTPLDQEDPLADTASLHEDWDVGGTQPTISVWRKLTSTVASQPGMKWRKKRGTAAARYHEEMAQQDKTTERLLTLLEGEIGSNSASNQGKRKVYDLEDAIEVVDRLVTEGHMIEASRLWCYAVTELNS